jgi:hypothetical protein
MGEEEAESLGMGHAWRRAREREFGPRPWPGVRQRVGLSRWSLVRALLRREPFVEVSVWVPGAYVDAVWAGPELRGALVRFDVRGPFGEARS